MNMMDDGMLAASAGANEEIAIEVFAGDIDGGLGGASIVFTIDPASAAMITGFAPAEGMTLLGISGNMVDVGAEQAVMLSNGGFLGTLKLMTGSEAVPFTGWGRVVYRASRVWRNDDADDSRTGDV